MIEDILSDAEERMKKTIDLLRKELATVRAGRANPAMLDKILVDYYGTPTPINQMAAVAVPEPRLLTIQPWDKSMIPVIEKEILCANLGFNPQNNGELIRIQVPPLTEERRREFVKQAKIEAENAKVGVRNARRDAMTESKNMKKNNIPEDTTKKFEEDLQKVTDDFIKKIDQALEQKEKDIMTV